MKLKILRTCGAFVQFRFPILGFAEPKSGTIALVRENSLVWTFKIKCWRDNNGQLEKRNEKWKYFLGVCGWSCKMMLLHNEEKFEKSAKLAQSFWNYFKIKHWCQKYIFWIMHPTTQLGALSKRDIQFIVFAVNM